VAAIKREPAPPPGPIADLFARLDDLHSKAGWPSMREITRRAGRGEISSSTVHNVFSSPKVPRRSFLELIVKALGGDALELGIFYSLWDAAWRAENNLAPPQKDTTDLVLPPARVTSHYPELPPRLNQEIPQGVVDGWTGAAPRPQHRIWSNEIPSRKPNFTGRATELQGLRQNLLSGQRAHVQVISGVGGVGKTELATEYVHRNIDTYEIVWWIRAEHQDRVRDALVKLGQRLELRQATSDSARDRTVAAVVDALQSGTWSSWLLVFDNAANVLDLLKYIPASRPQGHVIITARQPILPVRMDADSLEVSPFTDAESVTFLRRTVPGLAGENGSSPAEDARLVSEARRLAATLAHLPIAVEHAAAYLAETGHSVDEYLTRFTENAYQLTDEHPTDSDVPAPVLGTWAMSITLLTRDAEHLFNLCSFFSPEPIAAELFLQPSHNIEDPPGLGEFLSSSQRFRAAATQLHRLSLARVDGARDLIQVHRVVQAVTQRRLRLHRIEVFRAYRAAADTLLGNSNPGNPDHGNSDQVYDHSLQHLESDDRFLYTENLRLRTLIIDQVRRLHLRGGHVEAVKFGEDALRVWRERLGEDDIQVLALSVEVAIAMYIGSRTADAHELILHIRPLLRRYTKGDGYRVLLLCENFYGLDLRAHNQFRDALALDLSILPKFQSTFGTNNERTLNVSSNIAIDYRQLGEFRKALETDENTLRNRESILGATDIGTLMSANAVARDLRGLGLYQESLDLARKVRNAFQAVGGRENIRWLHACEGFATALRKAGHHWDAQQECEHVLQRCRDYLGADHMYTLRAAADLINDRRAVDDLSGAEELARQTHELCLQSSAPEVLLYTVQVNLASVLRVAGKRDVALLFDDQARKGFLKIHGDKHPFTLAANINYASDLVACAKLGEAIELGQETLDKCRDALGPDHPDTLIAAANLSRDEVAAGDAASGELHLAEALNGYERTLTLEHAEARAAAQWIRLTAEIEPFDLLATELGQVRDDPIAHVRDQLEQVRTINRGIHEPLPLPEPVRVQTATADAHLRAGPALPRKRLGTDLPGHRRRVVKGVVEAS
jgi:tetratricopeptide (TPR) repeat protein